MGFLLRTLITALGLGFAAEFVDGIAIDQTRTMLLSATLLGQGRAMKPVKAAFGVGRRKSLAASLGSSIMRRCAAQ